MKTFDTILDGRRSVDRCSSPSVILNIANNFTFIFKKKLTMTNSKTVSMKIYFVELSVDCECPKSKGNISPGDCLSNSSRKAVESSNQAIDSPR